MKVILSLFRWIVGATFIFSGFVKVIDPLGYGYKIADYLEAMNLASIDSVALPMAIIFAVLELVIGFSLFFNLLPRLGALGALLMLVFFTPLTLWLAIANPVQDCGCFGDALVITNWQTFFKNLVLLAMSVLLFWKRKKIKANFRIAMQWVVMFIVGFATLGLCLYCLYTLPIVDFRPYHVGANIAEGMIIPEDAPKPVVESKFIYEKNGNKQEFKAENAPTGNSEWTFVDAKHEIIDPGYIPPIHDFTIERTFFEEVPTVDPFDIELVFKNADGEQMYIDVSSIPDSSWQFENAICEACESEIDAANIAISYQNADGEIVTLGVNDPTNGQLEFIDAVYNSGSTTEKDITNQVLADERYSFLMIALNLENMDKEHLAEIDSIAKFANENNMGFYCLTHSDENAIAAFIEEYKPEYQFYNTDEITLKTIVRSNPGLLLIKKGTILGKWHDGNLPQVAELRNDLTAKMLTQQHNERNTYLYFVWILSTLFAMAFIGLVFNWLIRKRFINDNNNKI